MFIRVNTTPNSPRKSIQNTGVFKRQRTQACLRDVVLARLVYPCSKHQAQKKLLKHFDKRHSLDAIYCMMDALYSKIDDIKKRTFEKAKTFYYSSIRGVAQLGSALTSGARVRF